jgi:hypothetical protein
MQIMQFFLNSTPNGPAAKLTQKQDKKVVKRTIKVNKVRTAG